MSFENAKKLVTFTNSAILDFSLGSFANSIVKCWTGFLDMPSDFLSVPFYWSKKTYFLYVCFKEIPPKTNSWVNFNIFQKLHILNYHEPSLCSVKVTDMVLYLRFSITNEVLEIAIFETFLVVKLCFFHKYLRWAL